MEPVSWKRLGRELACKVPLFVGLEDKKLVLSMREGRDFLYFDHGYFGACPTRCRVIRGGVHLQTLLDRPNDRLNRFQVRCEPWKGGKTVIVIPPSESAVAMFGLEHWLNQTLDRLGKQTDRPIIVKRKNEGPLLPHLEDAHCLVDYGSRAAVEALIAGVPVFAGPMSPALPVTAGADIEKPVYPDREPWLRSLAYATWDTDELVSLEANAHSYFYDCP